MKLNQVAVQLYSLRQHLKTPEAISVSLERVKQIGYQAVQVSGIGPIEPQELRRIFDRVGVHQEQFVITERECP